MNKRGKLINRLKDKTYRDSFVESHIKNGIPFQIRKLREKKGWTQKDLADRIGSKQAWIAQIENPDYSRFSLKTLLKLASVFDVGLMVRYVPFSNLVKWELNLSHDSLTPMSFDEDHFLKEGPRTNSFNSMGFISTYNDQSESKILPFDVEKRRNPIEKTLIGQQKANGSDISKKLQAGQGI